MEEAIFVSSVDDCLKLKKYTKIKFICKKCNSEKTCLEKYGYSNGAQVSEFKEKFQKTNLEKYGNVCSLNGKEQIKKKKETWLKNYGVENPFQIEETREKVKNNNIEKYGIPYAICTKESQESQEKSLNTKIKNRSLGLNKLKYLLDELTFDSSWEVAFYIYFRDKGLKIERNKIVFEYFFNDKKCYTFVDFSVGSFMFEIKSNYIFHLDKKQEVRNEFLLNKGVIFIDDNSIQDYLSYVKNKYGNKYIDSLKCY